MNFDSSGTDITQKECPLFVPNSYVHESQNSNIDNFNHPLVIHCHFKVSKSVDNCQAKIESS